MNARSNTLRIWLIPFSILLSVAVTLLVLTFLADTHGRPDAAALWHLFIAPNPMSAANTLSNAGEIVAGVLAMAITVAAIVVELASTRYTHRITELFIAEPTNFIVTGFFVVAGLQGLWVTMTFDPSVGFVPHWGIVLSMVMLTISLLILIPYFAFIFHFLQPVNILARIRMHTLDVVRDSRDPVRAKAEAVRGIEQLADVALNAMESKDKGVSMMSVEALRQLTEEYQALRPALTDAWFQVDGELARNPDFVSMAPEILQDVSSRRYWVEMKVLRQYQTLYNEALNKMRDINYVVAISTRRIGELAMRQKNDELVDLVVKFFNTFMRATINARDVRTAYNVLNQYRLFGEALLDYGNGSRAVEVARYFKYYGRLSFDQKQPFVLETVAYDLCTLNEIAFDKGSAVRRDILRIFLEVDKESETEIQEASLRGVRKAQLKLATYYLLKGDETAAREVYRDMLHEKPERLASIRDELLAVQSREFWEISDRGQNFDYLSPERKARMLAFFDWFGDVIPARPSLIATVSQELPAAAPAGVGEETGLAPRGSGAN